MIAVFAFLAILLATLTGHAPAVPAAAAVPLPHHDTQVGQATNAHRPPARSAAPVVVSGDVPAPAPVTHAPTVAATSTPPWEMCPPDGGVMMTDDPWIVANCPLS